MVYLNNKHLEWKVDLYQQERNVSGEKYRIYFSPTTMKISREILGRFQVVAQFRNGQRLNPSPKVITLLRALLDCGINIDIPQDLINTAIEKSIAVYNNL